MAEEKKKQPKEEAKKVRDKEVKPIEKSEGEVKSAQKQVLKEEVPEARAVANYLRVSPRKARAVVDLIRGKDLDEALGILKFCPRKPAQLVEKIVNSAAANAERNTSLNRESLYVATAYVDQGSTLKRFRHRAMGRASRIRKRTSHVTVVLSQKEA